MPCPYGKTLIGRLVEGERSALSELFDLYARVVNALAQRLLGTVGSADDLVQEVFLRAWREAERYDARGGTPMAWLFAMTRDRDLWILGNP